MLRIQLLLVLQLQDLVHVRKLFVLLLDSSEFDAASLGTPQENILAVREREHQVEQILLRKTMRVSRLLNASLVRLAGAQTHQYLIVAEVAGRVQSEILIPVFLGERHSYFPIKNEIQFTKVLQALDDCLICNEHSTIELRDEEGEEFVGVTGKCVLS